MFIQYDTFKNNREKDGRMMSKLTLSPLGPGDPEIPLSPDWP